MNFQQSSALPESTYEALKLVLLLTVIWLMQKEDAFEGLVHQKTQGSNVGSNPHGQYVQESRSLFRY